MKIIPDPVCTKVQRITICHDSEDTIMVDGVCLDRDERNALAFHDGFASFAQMMQFWDGRLPFSGEIIHWRPQT